MSMGTAALGRTIRLYLVDGTATGVITAEVMNWTGKASVSPRARLPDLVRRSETERSGIYLLIGEDLANRQGQRSTSARATTLPSG